MLFSNIYALVGILIVGCCVVIPVIAQESPQERVANLRAQLTETQAKQAELQTRLRQLEEDIKPENIERSLAGVGSAHPEELREARRRQLEIEKKGVEAQLEVLTASRTRLEASIARADTESYQESAGIGPNASPARTNNAATVTNRTHRPRKHRPGRRLARRPRT